jgi:hypothetical protein
MENIIDPSKIKKLDLTELAGRVLQMVVVSNGTGTLVAGKDIQTGEIFVLNYFDKTRVSKVTK